MPDPVLSQGRAEGQVDPNSALTSNLEEFVSLQFSHGVPYSRAHSFGPEALPVLRRMLNDENYRDRWTWIVTTIAFIGAPEGFPILRSFLLDQFHGEVDTYTLRALLATPSMMGTIHTPEVTEFLATHVNPSAWTIGGGTHR